MLDPVRPGDFPQVVAVWEASVRASHNFLTEADIQFFKPFVRDALLHMGHLACVRDEAGEVVGFIGVMGHKIEMLFVHPQWQRRGVGRQLLEYAVKTLGANQVDVNEQNHQAVEFYKKMGFVVEGRSELDTLGKPFPLLHLIWNSPS